MLKSQAGEELLPFSFLYKYFQDALDCFLHARGILSLYRLNTY